MFLTNLSTLEYKMVFFLYQQEHDCTVKYKGFRIRQFCWTTSDVFSSLVIDSATVNMPNSVQIDMLPNCFLQALSQIVFPRGSHFCTLTFLTLYFFHFLTLYPQD